MDNMAYKERKYRNLVGIEGLVRFNVVVKETDLLIHASKFLPDAARDLVLKQRGFIEKYIEMYPEFRTTLVPWHVEKPAPVIVSEMAYAGLKAGVGPMAAVAGAIAEQVGKELLSFTDEVVVENGGDIFIKTEKQIRVGIFAAGSPLSLKMGLLIDSGKKPAAVCTSSGTVGHSLSFGKADAVCIVSDSCFLADAAATSVGNRIRTKRDIDEAIEFGKNIEGVTGMVIIIGDAAGFWGDIELVPV
jgi:uncharacterized protein